MWNVIYFSKRYFCLFWYKMEVAKAFLPHQWVWGWLRGFNWFATNGIDHSWLRLVIWNKFSIQIIGFMTGCFYYWFYTAVIPLPWVIGGKHSTRYCVCYRVYKTLSSRQFITFDYWWYYCSIQLTAWDVVSFIIFLFWVICNNWEGSWISCLSASGVATHGRCDITCLCTLPTLVLI